MKHNFDFESKMDEIIRYQINSSCKGFTMTPQFDNEVLHFLQDSIQTCPISINGNLFGVSSPSARHGCGCNNACFHSEMNSFSEYDGVIWFKNENPNEHIDLLNKMNLTELSLLDYQQKQKVINKKIG